MLTHLIDVDLEESVDFALDVLATLHLIRGRFQMTKQMPFEGKHTFSYKICFKMVLLIIEIFWNNPAFCFFFR